MVPPPPPPPPRLLLVALVGLLSLCEYWNQKGGALGEANAQLCALDPQVVAETVEEAGTRCPKGLWPLPPQVDGVAFLYHPCAHPWLKFQLAFLAHVCVAKPTLIPDSNLTWARAPTLAFALRSWRPPGVEVTSRGPGRRSLNVVKRRRLRAALGLQSTPSGLKASLASSPSPKAQQPILGTSSVAPVSLTTGRSGGNDRSRTEAQMPSGQGNPGGCACPGKASPAPRAAAPPRVARGPTPRTEEAAWAAMALTFLLVLLTLATLCTRLHRNFRRSESIYWGPTADSQDTVAAVLKRRLPLPSRRIKRSRRRPLLPPTPDSGPDSESSD
ncbi:hypothetical protein U0070_003538 [Myodes glareolus]|uniref:Tumor protein p53-inducible protein 13 n=1 Tax=Myodes glareolus TaxID=447135 RepID=A0AAW0JTJ8_MYOGA